MLQGNQRFTAILGCANRFGTKWDKEEVLFCEKGHFAKKDLTQLIFLGMSGLI
jgi:hypothetical protein